MVFLRNGNNILFLVNKYNTYLVGQRAKKDNWIWQKKKLLHNNYNFGLVGKKNMTKNHGNTQVSTLNWVKVLQKENKQICNLKVFQYYVSYFVLNFKLKLGQKGFSLSFRRAKMATWLLQIPAVFRPNFRFAFIMGLN